MRTFFKVTRKDGSTMWIRVDAVTHIVQHPNHFTVHFGDEAAVVHDAAEQVDIVAALEADATG